MTLLFQYDKTINRLERYIRDISANKRPLLQLRGQLQFSPSLQFDLFLGLFLIYLCRKSVIEYLGHTHKMFDDPSEEPVLTWSAISWLLEDYGLSRTETIPADVQIQTGFKTMVSYSTTGCDQPSDSCPCARRYKWNPTPHWQALRTIGHWYLVLRQPQVNVRQHIGHFEAHRYHLDPVCFRAVVFGNTLANWCGQWNVTIDVNQYLVSTVSSSLEIAVQTDGWVRIVEAMAITHFIAGAHKCLINEFPRRWSGSIWAFPEMATSPCIRILWRKDDDLRNAVIKWRFGITIEASKAPPAAPDFFRDKANLNLSYRTSNQISEEAMWSQFFVQF